MSEIIRIVEDLSRQLTLPWNLQWWKEYLASQASVVESHPERLEVRTPAGTELSIYHVGDRVDRVEHSLEVREGVAAMSQKQQNDSLDQARKTLQNQLQQMNSVLGTRELLSGEGAAQNKWNEPAIEIAGWDYPWGSICLELQWQDDDLPQLVSVAIIPPAC